MYLDCMLHVICFVLLIRVCLPPFSSFRLAIDRKVAEAIRLRHIPSRNLTSRYVQSGRVDTYQFIGGEPAINSFPTVIILRSVLQPRTFLPIGAATDIEVGGGFSTASLTASGLPISLG